MLSIAQIHHNTSGSDFVYDLDTSLFNENIFKMCTDCGAFAHDFSKIFCSCGHKLHYVDVSDIETLKNWTKFFEEQEKVLSPTDELLSEVHNCDNSDDCIDCAERKWEDSEPDSESDESDESDDDVKDDYCLWDQDSVS